MTPYQAGVENGKLCRKYSNQYDRKPTDDQWLEAFQDPVDRSELGDPDDRASQSEFIRGCNDGWPRT